MRGHGFNHPIDICIGIIIIIITILFVLRVHQIQLQHFHKNQKIITSNGENEKNDWIERNKKCNYNLFEGDWMEQILNLSQNVELCRHNSSRLIYEKNQGVFSHHKLVNQNPIFSTMRSYTHFEDVSYARGPRLYATL